MKKRDKKLSSLRKPVPLSLFGTGLLLLATLVLPLTGQATGLSLSGLYGYEEDANGRFLEFTNNTATVALQQDLTQAMDLSEGLRYTQQYKEGSAGREDINPSAAFNLLNDIFATKLAASQSESRVEGRDAVISQSSQADLNSAWTNHWYPKLHFGLGRDRDYNDAEPRTSDRQIDHLNGSLDWNTAGYGLYYDYLLKKDQDKALGSDTKYVSHLARVTAAKRFWRDRLNLNFSHTYNFSRNDNSNTANINSQVRQKLIVSQALSGVDITPLTGTLSGNPGLNDGDRNTAALTVALPGQGYNIAAKLDLQTVDYLYLYTDADYNSIKSSFNWRLYTSPDGINWFQNTTSVTYNSKNLRFEIPCGGLSAVYVKVVLDYPLATPLPSFTEIEANDVTNAAPGTQLSNTTDITTNQTSFALGLKASEDVNILYSLSLYDKEYDPGRDTKTRSQNGSINYHPNRYLDSTVSIGDSWRQESDQLDTSTRIYGLQLGSSPLDTLDLHATTTLSDAWQGDIKTRKNQRYDFDLTAQLYPDLRGLYSFVHENSETVATGAETTSTQHTLEFNADLTPSLASTLSGEDDENKSGGDTTTTYRTSLSFSWHPGDLSSFNLRGDRTWHPGYTESQVLSASFNTKTSVNTQLDLDYTLTKKSTTSQSGTVNFRWNMLSWLYWQNIGTYQTAAANEFILKSTLTARFGTY